MKNLKSVISMLLIIIFVIGVFPNNINKVEAKTTSTIFISNENIYLSKKSTHSLQLYSFSNIYCSTINNKNIKWTSSNKKIATVDNSGKITAKKNGVVKITAKYKNKKYTSNVYVTNKKLLYEDKYVKIYFKELYDMKKPNIEINNNGFMFLQIYNKTRSKFSITSNSLILNDKIVKIGDSTFNNNYKIKQKTNKDVFFTVSNLSDLNFNKITSSMNLRDSKNNIIDVIDFKNIKIR